MNLNELAKSITLSEGLKKNTSIGQVKELMKLIFTALAKMTPEEREKIFKRYK